MIKFFVLIFAMAAFFLYVFIFSFRENKKIDYINDFRDFLKNIQKGIDFIRDSHDGGFKGVVHVIFPSKLYHEMTKRLSNGLTYIPSEFDNVSYDFKTGCLSIDGAVVSVSDEYSDSQVYITGSCDNDNSCASVYIFRHEFGWSVGKFNTVVRVYKK